MSSWICHNYTADNRTEWDIIFGYDILSRLFIERSGMPQQIDATMVPIYFGLGGNIEPDKLALIAKSGASGGGHK